MTHHEEQPTAIESVLELLREHGPGAMAKAMQTLLNEAMKLERSEFLPAAPGERTGERRIPRTIFSSLVAAPAATSPCRRWRVPEFVILFVIWLFVLFR